MQAKPPNAPSPREVGDWQAAEANAVEWLRWLGYPDARPTKSGPDGGVDTIATGAFAQVKWYGKAIGRAPLQQLFGARAGRPGMLYFFTNAGYSEPAQRYADSVDMATFTYSTATGLIAPVSQAAHRAFEDAKARYEAPPPAPQPAANGPESADQERGRTGGTPPRWAPRPVVEYPPPGDVLHPDTFKVALKDIQRKRDARTKAGQAIGTAPRQPGAVGCLVAVACFAITVLLVIVDQVGLDGASPAWIAIPGTLSCILGVLAIVAAIAQTRGR